MLKNLVVAAFIALSAVGSVCAWAQQESPSPNTAKSAQPKTLSELESLVTTNDLFIGIARRVLQQAGTPRNKSLFETAENARRNGYTHLRAGELTPSFDDYSESTRLAIQLIIKIKNEQSLIMRESAIAAADITRAGDDRERKKALIQKGMAEAEIFLMTAERLLQEGESKKAALRLTEARTLYEKAKKEFTDGEYATALEDVNNSYKKGTEAVKIIKKERPEIITFPRSKSSNVKEALVTELKRNDAYRFFAAQLVSNNKSNNSARYMRKGNSLRDEAGDVVNGQDTKKAVDLLRRSTSSYIRAITLTSE